jgi:hypothetical protein
MYKHAEKLENYLSTRSFLIKWYNRKYPQMFYQLLGVIIIGSVAYGSPGTCSVPVAVFLKGLFWMYLAALLLNACVFLARCLGAGYGMDGYRNKWRGLNLRIDLCYWPLYCGFSILEFCWYVIGAEWLTEDNNCMDTYPQGTRLAQALVALWVIVMAAVFLGFVGVNLYLCCHRYDGKQTLGPEVEVSYPAIDVRSHPESPKIIHTMPPTPPREIGD